MPRPVHFEIHVDDPERAQRFYGGLFGWSFQKWEGGDTAYWLITTGQDGPGINGGMLARMGGPLQGPGPHPVIAFVCTMDVADIDASLAKAQELGAAVAVPKSAIPGMGWLAYCRDPDGNIFGIMQMDSAAA